jgi:hypothetical protein
MGTYSSTPAPKSSKGSEEGGDDDEVIVPNTCCTFSFQMSNFLYGSIMIIAAVVAILFKYVNPSFFDDWWALDLCSDDVCYGNQAIYRISMGTCIFFIVMLIGVSCWPSFHLSNWILKYSIFSIIGTIMFFIPGSVFVVYREISRYLSFFFLLFQLLLLINLVHEVHEALLSRMDDASAPREAFIDRCVSTPTAFRRLYVILFFSCAGAGIIAVALLFHYYGECGLHNGIIASVLVLGVLTTILSASESVGRGVLTPALLLAYLSFNCYQALQSNPDVACNPYAADNPPVWQLILMVIFNVMAIGWNATRTAHNASRLFKPEESHEVGDAEDQAAKAKENSSQHVLSKRSVLWFHGIMALAACYLAMMLTGWGAEYTTKLNNTDASEQSFWIKTVNLWVAYALYIWTLVAPIVLKNREFS